MIFMKNLVISLVAAIFGLTACASANDKVSDTKAYKNYLVWLDGLKKEMVQKGISKDTIDKVYGENDFYHEKPAAVVRDRKQLEFVLSSEDYLNRVAGKIRAEKARAKYKELKPLWNKIEAKYNLPAEYIVAFWGAETNFGSHFGGYNVIDALTEMSYDKRRSEFFKKELYNALKIIDEQGLDYKKMRGSWAGAMGHFQFMPTTYKAYGVDFNGDGIVDIWDNFEDAAASAANYLTSIGWDKDIPWGWEVNLPWNFDYSLSGRDKFKAMSEWQEMGVTRKDGKAWKVKGNVKGALLTPEGSKGAAYLVTENFGKIMQWNRSENYALAIGLLADYALSGKPWQSRNIVKTKLKSADVKKVQAFINKTGLAKLEEDGQLGSKTKEAIKLLQKKVLLISDGYPDKKLMHKIDNYNPQLGLAIAVPERKLHKQK